MRHNDESAIQFVLHAHPQAAKKDIIQEGTTKLLPVLLEALDKQESAYGEKLLWKLVCARPDSATRVMEESDSKHTYPLFQSRRLLPAMVGAKDYKTNSYFVMQEFLKADRKEEVLAALLDDLSACEP